MKNILIFVLLICLVLSQGGGGGRSGGSRSSSSRSSRKKVFVPPKSGCTQSQCPALRTNCDTLCYDNNQSKSPELKNCIAECEVQYGQKQGSYWPVIGIIGTFIVLVIAFQEDPKKEHKKFIQEHKQKTKEHQCNITQLQNQFESIIRKQFSLTFYQNSRPYLTDNFKIQGQKHEQKYLFNIKMESSDYFGFWTANGFISSSSQGLKIWFQKYYKDKNAARQTGKWSTIIYQGLFDENTGGFKGGWKFRGFDNDPIYSGAWESFPLKRE